MVGCWPLSPRNQFLCWDFVGQPFGRLIAIQFSLFTLCMFLLGCMLYLPLITLIFYRFTFVNVTMAALTPPYWINMGAVAITTSGGCATNHRGS